MSDFEPGDRVVHEEYGPGTVKEHPDATDYANDPRNYGTFVYFEDTPETTLRQVPSYELEEET